MKAKLDYYKIFYETARHSSFSAAARRLYISQSAISQCIRTLEEELETKLFFRTRRGVVLTKEGELLFRKVDSAMQALEQGEMLLARLHHLDSGSLVIAAGDTITSRFLLPYLEDFHAAYPGISIKMENSYSQHMIECVKEGKAELAFVNLPVKEDSELEIIPCLEIHDIFVCGHEFKMKKSYTRHEMAMEELILLETNSTSRRFIDAEFEKSGVVLKPHIEMAAHELLIRFASIHLGISCVIEEFSKEELKSGIIRKMPLDTPLPKRSIGCVYLKHNPLSVAAKEFLKSIKRI